MVFHVHGYAEHCGRSKELAGRMAEMGILSFAHDHGNFHYSQGFTVSKGGGEERERDIYSARYDIQKTL